MSEALYFPGYFFVVFFIVSLVICYRSAAARGKEHYDKKKKDKPNE